MYRRILAVAGAIALSIPATAAVAATPSPDNSPAARFQTVPSVVTGKNFVPKSVNSNQDVSVIVELKGDPTAVVQAKKGHKLSDSERDAIKGALKNKQDAITGAIEAKGGKIVGQMQSAYNGIQVRIPAKSVDAVAKLPNVVAVYPARTYTVDNAVSVPFLGVPDVWQNTGYTGKGVKVGIIDTGIDYTHANFAGPGTVGAYNAQHKKEAKSPSPGLFGPKAPRVKGGTDLVGDSYNADPNADPKSAYPYQPVPHSDSNPLDCGGHGSHVAGTVAGNGENADGSTYFGPYNASTPSKTFKIGPGVAPQADLYAIRVFGCEGSTDVVVQAIDWAVDHQLDVINMSLGSSFGRPDDADAVAASNAVGAGVVVVTSAGNSGPNPYIVGSPSTGDGVISVAAMDSTAKFPGAMVTTGGQNVAAINANGASLAGLPTMTVKVLKDIAGTAEDESLGCSVAAYTANGVTAGANIMAVSTRGTCARVAKAIFAQQAGAAAALMINNATDYPPFEGPITSNPDDGVAYTVTIPFLGVPSTQASKFVTDNTATVAAADLDNPGYKKYASFSSGGPRNGDSGLGVDLAAPGVSIHSTGVGTGNGEAVMSGTSMAAPHVTGVAALAVQSHPNWDANDVALALVGTADPTKMANQNTVLGGVGLVNAAGVVSTQVTAAGDSYTNESGTFKQNALNFGYAESATTYSGTKTVTLTNHGNSAVTYTPSAQLSAQSRPASVTFSVSSITVPAHGTASFQVMLNANASAVGTSMTGNQFTFREFSGAVALTSGSSTLRVPFLMVPRALTQVTVTDPGTWNTAADSTTTMTLKNTAALAAFGDAYQWGQTDPQDVPASRVDTGYDIRATGVQSWDWDASTKLLVFAVNVWNKWNNAAENEFDVNMDTNGDGNADYAVFAADQGAVTAGSPNGVMGVYVYNYATKKTASSGFLAQSPTDRGTVLLPVLSSALGLTSANGSFGYNVTGFSYVQGGSDTTEGVAGYNPWSPALSFDGGAGMANGSTATLDVSLNAAAFAAQHPLGVMNVLGDNAAGAGEALLTPVP